MRHFRKTRSRTTPSLDKLVTAACRLSREATHARLTGDLTRMSAAELRGYVRARAFEPVWQSVELLTTDYNLSKPDSRELLWRSLEKTALLVARTYASRAKAVPYVPLRLVG